MKTITFETNFNGKLACARFTHIDLPPTKEVTRQQLDNTQIKIQVADQSHQPVTVQLDNIVTMRIGELSNAHTWPSHGLNTTEFIHQQHLKNKGGINQETMLAVYYYRRI